MILNKNKIHSKCNDSKFENSLFKRIGVYLSNVIERKKDYKSGVGIIEFVINQLSTCSEVITAYKTIPAIASNWR